MLGANNANAFARLYKTASLAGDSRIVRHDAIRSCDRGAGISRQSHPLDAVAIADLRLPCLKLLHGRLVEAL